MREIITITTHFMLNITVNCYLVKLQDGFILIDTAKAGKRRILEEALENAGCTPDNLKLIVLTHGDFDHCGNAAYLKKKFNAPIAMHEADRGMVEQGNMFWNRKQPNPVVKALMGLISSLSKEDCFMPDVIIKEGDRLSEYGFDAEVIALPGHSSGSIGLLTDEGHLFCGDLLANVGKPDVWSIIDDEDAMQASVAKLKNYSINHVYPGHGQPFPMSEFSPEITVSEPEIISTSG